MRYPGEQPVRKVVIIKRQVNLNCGVDLFVTYVLHKYLTCVQLLMYLKTFIWGTLKRKQT